jgi:CubicO group peptidase (beta-lactamase class C family)
VFATGLLPQGPLGAAGAPRESLQDKLSATVAVSRSLEAPGCVAGIFRKGKVIAAAASGAADVEAQRANTLDTQFYAASLSKQFTAVALLQLVANGKLSLRDDIRRYLPEFPDYGQTITVEMLLHHKAGIVDHLNVAVIEGSLDAGKITRAEALGMLQRQKALRYVAGTRFEYSNGGYLLLSEIVERVSGEPFESYVGTHVLKPLGMTRSFMMRNARSTDANLARGYTLRDGKPALSDKYPPFGGSGGLVTTLNDLAKWDRDIDSGHKVWTPAVARLMLEGGKFANGAPVMRRGHSVSYAGGLAIAHQWIQHTGTANGFSNIYARHPRSRTGIALLCNDGTTNSTAKADAIAALIGDNLPPVGEIAVNPHPLDGSFRSDSIAATYQVTTTADGLTLVIRSPEKPEDPAELTLTRTPEGEYRFTGLLLSPDDDNDGFTLSFGLVSYHFARVR